MPAIIALAFLVTAITLWRLHTIRSRQRQPVSDSNRSARNLYHCVEVCPGSAACKAAHTIGNIRFLYQEAPRFPVPGCTEQQCTCGYIHHDDRREHASRQTGGPWQGYPYATVGARRDKNALHTLRLERQGSNTHHRMAKIKGRTARS